MHLKAVAIAVTLLLSSGAVIGYIRLAPHTVAPVAPAGHPFPPGGDALLPIAGTDAVNASNLFATELYARYRGGEGNIFFSPLSISTALAMTYEGARGRTADEIRSVFHFPADDAARRTSFAALLARLNGSDTPYRLSTANALWVQKDYRLLDEYTEAVQRYYYAKAANVDFKGATEEARSTINGWVEHETNDKIRDLFPPGTIDPGTRLVLTNAIYFKGTWVTPFDKGATKNDTFRVGPGRTVQVPMMSTGARFNYTETDEAHVLEMAYAGDNLSMLVILPKADDLSPIEKTLTPDKIAGWRRQLNETRMDVYMPRFTVATKYFMNDNLSKMGMPTAFSDGADFSGINGKKELFISHVIHQAYVDVNEEGTEAAAATGVAIGVTSVTAPVPVFRADHPFVFLIQERATGAILFMGRVSEPKT